MKTLEPIPRKRSLYGFRFSRRFAAVCAAISVSLGTWANGQGFYTGGGSSGFVGKVTPAGAPSTFASYPGGQIEGVTTDAAGNVFVANGSSIYKVTPDGVSTLFASYANPIAGLAMSSSGILYGVSTAGGPSGGHDVGIYGEDGSFTSLTLTNPGFAPFYPSNGLKFDEAGNLFVTNSGNGGTYGESVLKLTPDGSDWTASAFVSYGMGTFQPYDVTFDPLGNVYVSSALATSTIAKYDATGALDLDFVVSGMPDGYFMAGLTFVNDKLYVIALGSYKLWEIDPLTGAATDFLGVGSFLPDYRSTFLTYTAVPEPSQKALILFGGLGLAGLGVYRKAGKRVC